MLIDLWNAQIEFNAEGRAAQGGDFVTVLLLIKFSSISFQPKWPPLVSFLNLCHTFMFLTASGPPPPPTPLYLFAVQERKGREKSHNSRSPRQQQSDDLVSNLFCWVRNGGMGEGDAAWKE